MSDFKIRFENVASIPYAEVTAKGIRYGRHEFNAKTTIKDPESKKDVEVTVVRRAEREWMLGCEGGKEHITKQSAIIFNTDESLLKQRAEYMQIFIFGEKP